jgi:predicted AAA+ superfamily ATPase
MSERRAFRRGLVVGLVFARLRRSNDVGASATTIKNRLGVLKASFVLFELPPFFVNIRKHVIKSPKISFTDVGLAAFLLGIHTEEQASRDPLRSVTDSRERVRTRW